jgi:hypothetical protein
MAKAAMDKMRQDRNPPPSPMKSKPSKNQMAKSQGGSKLADPDAAGKLPDLVNTKKSDWGKLPPKMAEALTKAQHEPVSDEYRESIDMYYRVIAERAKKSQEAPTKAQP